MRLLWITNWLPFPPISGNPLRVFNLLKRISQEHQVNLLTFIRDTDTQESLQALSSYCEEIFPIPADDVSIRDLLFSASLFNKIAFLFFPWRAYLSRRMVKKLQELTSSGSIDVLQIEDSFMGEYVHYCSPLQKVKCALTFHDIDYLKYQRLSKITANPKRKIKFWLRSIAMKHWEPRLASYFDANFFTSALDEKIMLKANPRINTMVLPNGVDTKELQPLPINTSEKSILFVGNMSYLPNEDGVLYFYHEILPIIAKHISNLHFYIVGLNPSDKIKNLESTSVHVTGSVPNLLPYYQRCTACIIPLRAGGGTRLKILEAMAYGRPVVSTSLGCEGLEVEDGKHLLIADSPQEFAEKTILLLTNNDLQQMLINNARELVEQVYDWDIIAQHALHMYEKLHAG